MFEVKISALEGVEDLIRYSIEQSETVNTVVRNIDYYVSTLTEDQVEYLKTQAYTRLSEIGVDFGKTKGYTYSFKELLMFYCLESEICCGVRFQTFAREIITRDLSLLAGANFADEEAYDDVRLRVGKGLHSKSTLSSMAEGEFKAARLDLVDFKNNVFKVVAAKDKFSMSDSIIIPLGILNKTNEILFDYFDKGVFQIDYISSDNTVKKYVVTTSTLCLGEVYKVLSNISSKDIENQSRGMHKGTRLINKKTATLTVYDLSKSVFAPCTKRLFPERIKSIRALSYNSTGAVPGEIVTEEVRLRVDTTFHTLDVTQCNKLFLSVVTRANREMLDGVKNALCPSRFYPADSNLEEQRQWVIDLVGRKSDYELLALMLGQPLFFGDVYKRLNLYSKKEENKLDFKAVFHSGFPLKGEYLGNLPAEIKYNIFNDLARRGVLQFVYTSKTGERQIFTGTNSASALETFYPLDRKYRFESDYEKIKQGIQLFEKKISQGALSGKDQERCRYIISELSHLLSEPVETPYDSEKVLALLREAKETKLAGIQERVEASDFKTVCLRNLRAKIKSEYIKSFKVSNIEEVYFAPFE